jgi:hypothetical protein
MDCICGAAVRRRWITPKLTSAGDVGFVDGDSLLFWVQAEVDSAVAAFGCGAVIAVELAQDLGE